MSMSEQAKLQQHYHDMGGPSIPRDIAPALAAMFIRENPDAFKTWLESIGLPAEALEGSEFATWQRLELDRYHVLHLAFTAQSEGGRFRLPEPHPWGTRG